MADATTVSSLKKHIDDMNELVRGLNEICNNLTKERESLKDDKAQLESQLEKEKITKQAEQIDLKLKESYSRSAMMQSTSKAEDLTAQITLLKAEKKWRDDVLRKILDVLQKEFLVRND
ncbi:uncharacterized protein [Rutidosis leptorrhynchoides]|uniref:uncharacterized protein n=1 Tax=Rutidosis leptorrhynchoides TaxID=125765 RepID=UPI003A991F03